MTKTEYVPTPKKYRTRFKAPLLTRADFADGVAASRLKAMFGHKPSALPRDIDILLTAAELHDGYTDTTASAPSTPLMITQAAVIIVYSDFSAFIAERLAPQRADALEDQETLRVHPVIFELAHDFRDVKARRDITLQMVMRSRSPRLHLAKFGEPIDTIDLLSPGDDTYGWLKADLAEEVRAAITEDAHHWLPLLQDLHQRRDDAWPAGLTTIRITDLEQIEAVAIALKDAGEYLAHRLSPDHGRLHLVFYPMGPAQGKDDIETSIQVTTRGQSYVSGAKNPYTGFVAKLISEVAPDGVVRIADPFDTRSPHFNYKKHGTQYLTQVLTEKPSQHRILHLLSKFPDPGF